MFVSAYLSFVNVKSSYLYDIDIKDKGNLKFDAQKGSKSFSKAYGNTLTIKVQ